MKKRNIVILTSLASVVLIVALAIYFVLFVLIRPHLEILECETKKSPDGRWTAVVQMEVHSAFIVTVAIYAVRLQGLEQKDRKGDLVLTAEVNYTVPAPSIDWHDGKLIVLLSNNQKYHYFVTPVSGIDVIVQEK